MKINEMKYTIKVLVYRIVQGKVTVVKRVCYGIFLNKKEVKRDALSYNNESLGFLFYENYKELRCFKYYIRQKNLPKLCYLLAGE